MPAVAVEPYYSYLFIIYHYLVGIKRDLVCQDFKAFYKH